jgi:hypothetical protein
MAPLMLASVGVLRLGPKVDDSEPDDVRKLTDSTFDDDATDEIPVSAIVARISAEVGKIAGIDEGVPASRERTPPHV